MFDFEVAAVIPMAGYSDRFPSKCPKQYFKIMGKPLFVFCVEELYQLDYINKICLVADNVELVENIIQEYFKNHEKFVVVKGGMSRHMSIKNGLVKLSKCGNYKVVVVHDGARPIIPDQLLIQIIMAASVHGAAGATRPLISTVVKPQTDGNLETSLDRNTFVLSETPQAFLFHLIMKAYQQCSQEDLENGTECLQLVLKYCSIRAKLIPGPDSLWKVTDKKDFYSIVPYMRELSTDVCLLSENQTEVVLSLKEALKDRVRRIKSITAGMDLMGLKQNFNTIVCLHEDKINQGSSIFGVDFESLLNVNCQGLVVHIINHTNPNALHSTMLHEILKPGRDLMKHYEKLRKGVVIIHYVSHGQEKRLIDLIVSVIFFDSQTISGQTLFL